MYHLTPLTSQLLNLQSKRESSSRKGHWFNRNIHNMIACPYKRTTGKSSDLAELHPPTRDSRLAKCSLTSVKLVQIPFPVYAMDRGSPSINLKRSVPELLYLEIGPYCPWKQYRFCNWFYLEKIRSYTGRTWAAISSSSAVSTEVMT